MNFNKDSPQSLKRPASGNITDNQQPEETPANKMMHLQNGPLLTTSNGPPTVQPEIHPVMVFDYEVPNANPMFRPRMGAPAPQFPPWRGGGPSPRPRGGFRGAPRPPWANNGPRGPAPNNFSPRKRGGGGPFRGGGFRGRGRGNNW